MCSTTNKLKNTFWEENTFVHSSTLVVLDWQIFILIFSSQLLSSLTTSDFVLFTSPEGIAVCTFGKMGRTALDEI